MIERERSCHPLSVQNDASTQMKVCTAGLSAYSSRDRCTRVERNGWVTVLE